MQGRRGITWLVLIMGLALSICLPGQTTASNAGWWRLAKVSPPSVVPAASSSLDAQTLGEKPVLPTSNKLRITTNPQELTNQEDSSASVKFPYNLELNVSFLYNQNNPALTPGRPGGSLPLFNYSMDYRLLPNLKVGLSGYLYYPDQGLSMNRPFGERVMGLGPGLKYDLGSWSFVVKSQVETGHWDRGEDLQNWLRVWYVF
ncbi:MAG: hypothetical protein ACOZF2_01005 [Thermodesulfobacteriota bacterium]